MKIVLISPYELGRQPFALAEPAAFFTGAGYTVRCLDLSLQSLDDGDFDSAGLVAIHLGMHTATRIAVQALPRIRERAPHARLCVYGLYAPVNEALFRELGVDAVLGAEPEPELLEIARRLAHEPPSAASALAALAPDDMQTAPPGAQPPRRPPLPKVGFIVPERGGLPPLAQYAALLMPDGSRKVCGFAEATRGCKHLCRHCPVVPVYNGRFRALPPEVVLADVAGQVEAGARHISFGDPDFLNGPAHARRLLGAMRRRFPGLSFDATIKIQHLLRHSALLPEFAESGCLFITSAVESLDDTVLGLLDKNHSRADFVKAHRLLRDAGIALAPTFIPFTPWATLDDYVELLRTIAGLGLVHSVPPVQLTIRLLVPNGSHLLHIDGFHEMLGPYDPAMLGYPWRHTDPAMDHLQQTVQQYAMEAEQREQPREAIFQNIWRLAHEGAGRRVPPVRLHAADVPTPRLSEPWYCCAEPTAEQLAL